MRYLTGQPVGMLRLINVRMCLLVSVLVPVIAARMSTVAGRVQDSLCACKVDLWTASVMVSQDHQSIAVPSARGPLYYFSSNKPANQPTNQQTNKPTNRQTNLRTNQPTKKQTLVYDAQPIDSSFGQGAQS